VSLRRALSAAIQPVEQRLREVDLDRVSQQLEMLGRRLHVGREIPQPDLQHRIGMLFVSNSLLGGDWELDEIPTVRDPAHMVQIGRDHRALTGEGQRRVTV
jgi:hypothetical protein